MFRQIMLDAFIPFWIFGEKQMHYYWNMYHLGPTDSLSTFNIILFNHLRAVDTVKGDWFRYALNSFVDVESVLLKLLLKMRFFRTDYRSVFFLFSCIESSLSSAHSCPRDSYDEQSPFDLTLRNCIQNPWSIALKNFKIVTVNLCGCALIKLWWEFDVCSGTDFNEFWKSLYLSVLYLN